MRELDEYINQVTHLPPAPRILPELMALLKQPNIDSAKVVQLISFEPSLTANVLQLCNSAFLGSALPVSNLDEAVTRLGFQPVYQLVAAISGSRALAPAQKAYGLDPKELWKHSVTAAVAAQLVARQLGDDETVVFTATLLHDVGKIVLSEALDRKYAKLLDETRRQFCPLLEIETNLLGVQHAEVGGRLLARWKFPANLVEAVWHHHDPKAAGEHERLAAHVYLGNMIAYFMGHGYGHQAFAWEGRKEVLDLLEISADHLPKFMIQTFDRFQLVESLFQIGN